MSNDNDRLLERVRKLLALTEARGATPEEAANAAAKVQAILFEHNLTLAQVERDSGNAKPKAGYDKTDFVLNATKFSVSWHRQHLSLSAENAGYGRRMDLHALSEQG
jgi:hypothetical protein